MPTPKDGESKEDFISRCMAMLVGEENVPQKEAAGRCYGIWDSNKMGEHMTTSLNTPKDFWNKLNTEFEFNLDAAADESNHLCDNYFSEDNCAFKNDWSGSVWVSPPWRDDNLDVWVAKAVLETELGHADSVVMFLPVRPNTAWFQYVAQNAEIRMIQEELKWDRPGVIVEPSMLAIFKSFRGHAGRPGHVGGSVARGGGSGIYKGKLTDKQRNTILSWHGADYQPGVPDSLYPRSNIPTDVEAITLTTGSLLVRASFKDTDESTAGRWLEGRLFEIGLPTGSVRAYQSGDYHNDWVTAEWQHTVPGQLPTQTIKSDKEIEFDIDAPCGHKSIKVLNTETRRIGAYATIWGELDCDQERMTKQAIANQFPLQHSPMMMWKHGLDKRFGATSVGEWDIKTFKLDELGMWVEGTVTHDGAWKALQDSGALGLSVGTVWYLVKRSKAADGSVNIDDWPLLDISIMEGGKQCVPSAVRKLKDAILIDAYKSQSSLLQLEWEEEWFDYRTPLQKAVLRKLSLRK